MAQRLCGFLLQHLRFLDYVDAAVQNSKYLGERKYISQGMAINKHTLSHSYDL